MNQQPKSTLFLIRLWAGEEGGTGLNWQGRIQPIGEGHATTFRDWPTLQQLLEEVLSCSAEPDSPDLFSRDEHLSTLH